MIGSFWNLCRACPSMPVDKLHSEYRSTYKWHEYTGSRQEVVRRPPTANSTTTGEFENEKWQNMHLREEEAQTQGCKMEPAMPRRKKHPELAYRTHELLGYDEVASHDTVDYSRDISVRPDRARSEERTGYHLRSSRRSRSEGPPRGPANFACRNGIGKEATRRRESDPDVDPMGATEEGGLLRKAISKISTEYRLQFAWPPGHHSRADSHQPRDGSLPRKSLSMGAIKPSAQAMIHKKQHNELDTKDVSELEPLVNDTTVNEKNIRNEKCQSKEFSSEYKKKFRPFSQYEYQENEGRFTNKNESKPEQETLIETKENGPNLLYGKNVSGWFKEVVELRKKAGEYKHRGWGQEWAPEHISELYNKQIELWEQVSRRSSLSALSLASTTRKPYTKEEKEEENNKKSSPSKGMANTTNTHRRGRDSIDNSARAVKEIIRHHLERTTGGSEYDGLILSPTREKLEPTIPKRSEDRDHQKENQSRSSPKKDSPQKTKRSTSKSNGTKPALRTIRSQSVGPTEVSEKSSPKRLSRSTTVRQQKTTRDSTSSPPSSTVRRPRPSSLNTTAFPRSKCSSVPPKSAPSEDRLSNTKTNKNDMQNVRGLNQKNADTKRSTSTFGDNQKGQKTRRHNFTAPRIGLIAADSTGPEKCTISTEDEAVVNGEREPDIDHVVKSPPEPTRVKSPEQIMMRSPDPVNWTVPLDTGKTFTVTQNVREGELMNRPHSEVKAWTPPDVPPPAAQSAPPELAEQAKAQAGKAAVAAVAAAAASSTVAESPDDKQESITISPPSSSTTNPTPTTSTTIQQNEQQQQQSETEQQQQLPSSSKQQPATVSFETSNPPGRSLASDVLEKARSRFDEFWGKKDARDDI